MAPDINTLPGSPRDERRRSAQHPFAPSHSRRSSQQIMAPPPTVTTLSSHRSSNVVPTLSSNENVGVPLRHPRPLTAAELYLECEKEQEAVVNRLTRELTALRAQTASVASNASHSSTSTNASLLPIDIGDPNPTHQMTGATHPIPSRRRASSSISSRSIPTPSTTASLANSSVTNLSTQVQAGSTASVPIGVLSQASADRAAAAHGGHTLSRQPSTTASGRSTPARHSIDVGRTGTLYTLPHRPSVSREPSYISTHGAFSTIAHAGSSSPYPLPSPAQSPSQSNYTDAATYRSEMDIVKAENEALRHRVRALERALQSRRRDSSHSDPARAEVNSRPQHRESTDGRTSVSSPAGVAAWAAGDGGVGGVAGPRERSESQSTTASSRRGTAGVGEDEVKVGESAMSAGVARAL